MTPGRDWRLHIGAHKTATTHLQKTLAAHAATLRDAGIDYVPYCRVRLARGVATAPGRLGWRRRLRRLPGASFERRFLRALCRELTGRPTVLVSDENFLGLATGLLRSDPYPCTTQLSVLRHLPRGDRVTLFLSIRCFAGIIPSAYVQVLRTRALTRADLDALRAELRARPPSWLGLVGRLRREFPDCDLRLWRHEDYAVHRQPILTGLVGRDVGPFPSLPPPADTRSPCAAAVAEAEALGPMPAPERRRRVAEIFEAGPASGPEDAFRPFDAEEVALLERRYAADLAEIDRTLPGKLMRPCDATV